MKRIGLVVLSAAVRGLFFTGIAFLAETFVDALFGPADVLEASGGVPVAR